VTVFRCDSISTHLSCGCFVSVALSSLPDSLVCCSFALLLLEPYAKSSCPDSTQLLCLIFYFHTFSAHPSFFRKFLSNPSQLSASTLHWHEICVRSGDVTSRTPVRFSLSERFSALVLCRCTCHPSPSSRPLCTAFVILRSTLALHLSFFT
jgi:hypothetical protein